MGITVDEKELREILELTPCEQNIMIAGKHGIGKSVIIKKFFEAKGKKVVICFCSQAADAGDIIGLPRFKINQLFYSSALFFLRNCFCGLLHSP